MARTFASPGMRLLLLVSFCLTLTAALPGAPVRAAVQRNQDIDNTLGEFDDGSFQVAASANYPPGTPAIGDQRGAVQLAPIAAIRTMAPSTDLPFPRVDAGVVALGRNIFAIGGQVSNVSSDSVIVSQVDLTTGALGAWNNEPVLPPVQHTPSSAATVGPRTQPAVAAYATSQDNGYLYVLGGSVNVGGAISSFSVLRATVQNGRITSWNTGDPMPNIPLSVIGLQDASAFITQLPNGKVFLYLIGGLQRYNEPGVGFQELPSRSIFYAEIDPATGKFINGGGGSTPNAWKDQVYSIPVANINPDAGIWDSAVVGGTFTNESGLTGTAFYIMGGRTLTNVSDSSIYRVNVNDDGTLTLAQPSGAGAGNATLGTARSGQAAVQFNGSVYVAGGNLQGQSAPNDDVLASYLRPDLRYPELGGPGSAIYFITKDGLPAPRAGHGMVVVPDSFDDPTKGYVYLVGGTNGAAGQSTVFRTTIGDINASQVSFPLEGYYISEPASFAVSNSRLRGIFWTTDQPAGSNIQISYRISNDANCATLATRTEAQAPWQSTNPGSTTGVLNTFSITSDPANCFQYRARLTPNNTTENNATPYLLRLGIQIEVPGATDLTVKSFDFALGPGGQPNGLAIVLHNQNVLLPAEPTLAADFGEDGPGSAPGSFFVDVFIYPPGVTPPADHPIPTTPTQYARLSIDVFRSELQGSPVGGSGFDFTIPADRPLCNYSIRVDTGACVPVPLSLLFPEVGTYQVVVVVDGDANVEELPNGAGQAESNNVYVKPGGLVVTEVPKSSFFSALPFIAAP